MATQSKKPKLDAQAILRITPSSHHKALPPSWRWELSEVLRAEGRRLRGVRQDRWVTIAGKFQNEKDKCESVASFERLRLKYPGIYEAWAIYSQADERTRWMVEAYLCADATMPHIADRAQHHVEAIFCYAKLFFDVLGKQKHRMYMMNQVFKPSVHFGLAEREYDVLWKLFGLLKGPLFLDRFISNENAPSRVTSYDQGDAASRELTKTSMANRVLVAARTIPVAYNQEVIFGAYNEMVKIENAAGGGEASESAIIANIGKLVTGFGFTIADEKPKAEDVHWSKDGVELRSHEMVSRAMGETVKPKDFELVTEFPELIKETAGNASKD